MGAVATVVTTTPRWRIRHDTGHLDQFGHHEEVERSYRLDFKPKSQKKRIVRLHGKFHCKKTCTSVTTASCHEL